MKLFLITTVLCIVQAHAELSCLTLGIWNPYVGIWCALNRKSLDIAANATIKAVETAANDVKDAGTLVVQHHPLVAESKYVNTAITNGTVAADTQLAGLHPSLAQIKR